ncbi:TcmI family type II polyketide cyclase [Nocardia sp. alder85J]|uniref:TcmI family type II polyketide cyclase n=1 Tax=Nocardia sp. alder85J TaxID=2862949 RepID=UPI001CD2829A|nr:TcmI family type II polyketide cyclase [Nocardia sp. alder85J]MCX4094703.1 TcmI family type II polyketide cyclase [Nocardia sp. alder85J]
MNRSLIVARIRPEEYSAIGEIFAESDRTELPAIAGVSRRELYALGDVYVHLLETSDEGAAAIGRIAPHPEFVRVSAALAQYVSPYLPTWRGPADARAKLFYRWSPETGPEHIG